MIGYYYLAQSEQENWCWNILKIHYGAVRAISSAYNDILTQPLKPPSTREHQLILKTLKINV